MFRNTSCVRSSASSGSATIGTNYALNPVAVAQTEEIENAGFACLKSSDEDGIGGRVVGVNGGAQKRGKGTLIDR